MAMYGKTIGNGYALTAVVGKRSVMRGGSKTFYQQYILDRKDKTPTAASEDT